MVAAGGVERLTHRAVAAAAGVPLGSTTYYFATLDDVLASAVTLAMAETRERLTEWSDDIDGERSLIPALVTMLHDLTTAGRERLIVEYELYMAALRRPPLRELSTAWDRALFDAVARHTDPASAEALTLVAQALLLRSAVSGTPLARADTEPVLRRVATTLR